MAIRYWDYNAGWDDGTPTASTAGGGTRYYWYHTTDATTTPTTWNTYAYITVIRRYLVHAPKHWDEKIRAAFTRLVNDQTRTGFKLELWIHGDIEITDPNIEVRTMEAFVPLFKSYATAEDRKKIDEFFAAHGMSDREPSNEQNSAGGDPKDAPRE